MHVGEQMLSASEVAFYATSATVIPVLILGYFVGLGQLARGVVAALEKKVAAAEQRIDDMEHDPEFGGEPMITLVPGVYAAIVDVFTRVLRRAIIMPLLVVLVALPIVGEITALVALQNNSAGSFTHIMVWLGLWTSLLGLIAPLLWTLMVVYRSDGRISRLGSAVRDRGTSSSRDKQA